MVDNEEYIYEQGSDTPKFTCQKYVCTRSDLNKLLPPEIKKVVQTLFYDLDEDGNKVRPTAHAWRMFWKGMTPELFFKELGCDFDNPTVRLAVALDIVKLDDESVSNDREYIYREHEFYSIEEYSRLLLNRNFRINLVNLAPEWSKIHYVESLTPGGTGKMNTKRTVDRMYQGVVLSNTVLGYLKSIYDNAFKDGSVVEGFDFEKDVYLPFTNGNDLITEVSLVPNTHFDISPTSVRAFYDKKYEEYVKSLNSYGITQISSFALVDKKHDKNHIGEYLLKVQKHLVRNDGDDEYRYIVLRMNKDGHICRDEYGFLDVKAFVSNENTILCVCEDDFKSPGEDSTSSVVVDSSDSQLDVWTPVIRDVPMVHSTTSSHFSIFRQRIPKYDLKHVRNYLQFKTRLEGMELCLWQLNRDIERKEVSCSYCFKQQIFAIQNLFNEILKYKDVISLQTKRYKLLDDFDDLTTRKTQINMSLEDKREKLNSLIDEYNRCNNTQLDRKLELGQIIKSLRIEIDKDYEEFIKKLQTKMDEVSQEIDVVVEELRKKLEEIEHPYRPTQEEWDNFKTLWKDAFKQSMDEKTQELEDKWENETKVEYDEHKQVLSDASKYIDMTDQKLQEEINDKFNPAKESTTQSIIDMDENAEELKHKYDRYKNETPMLLSARSNSSSCSSNEEVKMDVTKLINLIRQTEHWRGYIFALAYELNQMKQIKVKAEDATIKVRRLVHNFKERMEQVEKDVWDENHQFKKNFNLNGIQIAGLRGIILLYDWYACNAPNKQYWEMGFSNEDEFLEFRIKCNQTAILLRKNHYSDLLNGKKIKLQELINDLTIKLNNKTKLKYLDKYGWDAKEKEVSDKWSIDSVDSKTSKKIGVFAKAFNSLKCNIVNQKISGVVTKESITNEKIRGLVSNMMDVDKIIQQNESYRQQYENDSKLMKERTIEYLTDIGLIQDEKELESLALRSRTIHNDSDVNVIDELESIEETKNSLDGAIERMKSHRASLQTIIERVADAETKVKKLQDNNKKIFNTCLYEKNKQIRNRLFLQKIDNENKIVELQSIVKKAKNENLTDFSALETMRKEVDVCQKNYDNKVLEFKNKIGLTEDVIDQLLVNIYNKYQNEILSNTKVN